MNAGNSEQALTRRTLLGGAAAMAGLTAARRLIAQPSTVTNPEELKKIEAALPARAPAVPRRARRLLIFDLNVGYGGHGSIPTANTAFTLMGKKTGAFATVVSRDPAVFRPESLSTFDAVFFNNTVGNCFEDPALRESLVQFVFNGGGLMGVHGTSVAFTKWPGAIEDWPEFGIMLGGRGANHKANDEHVFIKLDDPTHPVNQVFAGQGFDYRDEFFRVHEPYSRDRVRVLMSIDTAKTDMQQQPSYGAVVRADNDYALAWVRQYGLGRVFYCTIAHHPAVFWDPKMLQFYLAATQFALGDLAAPTTPSAKLTPAIRAQERFDWRLALLAPSASELTFFEMIDKAAQLGVLYAGWSEHQKIGGGISKTLGDRLTHDDMRKIRLKLDSAGVGLTFHGTPGTSNPTDLAIAFELAPKSNSQMAFGTKRTTVVDATPPAAIVQLDKVALSDRLDSILKETRWASPFPVVFTTECTDGVAQRIEAFTEAVLRLANGGKP
ncbi:MAG TPA: ThuA domain-containing protein [Sedimentisphaerales bacterium]|nr:ThuA domain-containing protein [Sedimentisphaerales bacterium]